MKIIRQMNEADADAAARLEAECFSQPWSKQAFLDTLKLSYAYYCVAEEDGMLIGLCGLRNIAGEGEITNVAISEKYRKRGIAAKLLAKLLEEGKSLGIKAYTLEVREGNIPAICLYEKFGFEVIGKRQKFYDRPVEDALIMWKR